MTHLAGSVLSVAVALILVGGCAHMAQDQTNAYPAAHVGPRLTSAADDPLDGPCIQTAHACFALNPDVSQEALDQTICSAGYTKSIRPGSAYVRGVKMKLLREAGLDASRASDFELDHIVPLALGGHPRKLSNLALQRWDDATTKDLLEVRLHRQVCAGQISLFAAQACIAEDWHTCGARYPL